MIVEWATQLPSPNFSTREGCEVEAVVIHHISLPPGEFGTGMVQKFFANTLDFGLHPFFDNIRDMRVSAHFFVERDGGVTQFVDTANCAWHAGVSNWRGRDKVNLFSVGVELEGDMTTSYTDCQYASLNRLLAELKRAHPLIIRENVMGHEHVSPGRKTDPGPMFDWGRVVLEDNQQHA